MRLRFAPMTKRILLATLLTAGAAELALRGYNHFSPSPIFYSTSYNRFRGVPHSTDYDFHLNSLGFKDKEFTPTPSEGTFRIVALGDSFAFGVVPYKFNYLTLLEDLLSKPDRRIEVLNMGIPSIGPPDYLSLLRAEGLVLRPQMVLLSFFIGNDFIESVSRAPKYYSYSYLASFVRYLIVVRGSMTSPPSPSTSKYQDDEATFIEERYLELERERSQIYLRTNPRFDTQLNAAVDALRSIKAICDDRGIQLAVVLIPDELQINPDLQSKVLTLPPRGDPQEYDFSKPNLTLAAALREHNIIAFDLLEQFRSRSSAARLYKPNDSHWNVAGNKLAAELIASHISSTFDLRIQDAK